MSRVAALVVSDRAARGERADGCLAVVRDWAAGAAHEVVATQIVADEADAIETALRALCAGADIVVTCGGTGFGPRDVTPEATRRVLDRVTPGIDEHLRRESAQVIATAVLSRAVSGLVGATFVVNLPGSPRAVGEQLAMLTDLLPHAVDTARGGDHDMAPATGGGCGHRHAAHGGGTHGGRKALIERDDALRAILAVPRAPRIDEAALLEARGRTLAADVVCRHDEPAFARSAMDGYAYPAALVGATDWLPLAGEIHAGDAPSPWTRDDAVARILTGAPLGDGLVGVIPQEDVEVDGPGRRVRFREAVASGDCVRPAGHSLPRGTRLAARGTTLGPRELAVLASAGEARVPVFAAHRVALLSTGDEIVPLGADTAGLPPGRIFDSNTPLLRALLEADGLVHAGTHYVPDSLDGTIESLKRALAEADTVITMGGISVGDRDHVAAAAEACGARAVVRGVNFRPGRPFSVFADGAGKLIVALPGNPLSVLATYVLFARPVFDAWHGRAPMSTAAGRAPARAIITSAVDNPGGRWWAALGAVSPSASRLEATVDVGSLDSGSLLPLTRSSAFVLIPPHATLAAGDEADIYPVVRGSVL